MSTRKIFYSQVTLDSDWIGEQISRFLDEDRTGEDITTEGVIQQKCDAIARIEAAQNLVFAGAQIVPAFFKEICEVDLQISDGQRIVSGDLIGTITGPVKPILNRERVMLNLVQHLSGIATLTRAYVDQAAPHRVAILDTRKTLPGLRRFEKYAVAIGGGTNHRLDLFSGILVKDNHLAVARGVAAAVDNLRQKHPDRPIEVEVETEEQALAGLGAGADALLLDNMTAEEVRSCVKMIRSHPIGRDVFVEASGGISLENVGAYAQTGIDGISIGRLTHSAPAVDIRVELMA
ncbi:carboxylating nicotinate-nucleotide diphosphorylase [Candidatus Neomarinimicrobiota bacterium]